PRVADDSSVTRYPADVRALVGADMESAPTTIAYVSRSVGTVRTKRHGLLPETIRILPAHPVGSDHAQFPHPAEPGRRPGRGDRLPADRPEPGHRPTPGGGHPPDARHARRAAPAAILRLSRNGGARRVRSV